jgi:hypothetical protein
MSNPVLLFFRAPSAYGWSERYWYNADITLPQAVTDVTALANARAGILVNSFMITHARIGTATKRLIRYVPLNGGTGIPGTQLPNSSPTEVCLRIQWSVAGVGFNETKCRGLPERISQSDDYTPDLPFTAAVQAFGFNQLQGMWNIRGTLGSPPLHYPASAVAPQAPRGFTATIPAPFAGVVGQQVRLHGCLIPGYNGVKTIVQTNVGSAIGYLFGGASPPVAESGTGAYFTNLTTFDQTILDYNVIGIGRRGAGRPFGLSRGRKPTLYPLRR